MSLDLNKEKFNKLLIEEQVNYINKKLKSQSLTKISESLGVDRATIRKRFKKDGYIFNKETSIYKKSSETNKSNSLNSVKKSLEKDFDIDMLQEDITLLKRQIKDLNDKFDKISKPNTKTTKTTNLEIEVFEGEIVSRSYKLDKDIQQDFKVFCKENSKYRVSDILSTALKQFLKNQE